MSPTFGRLRGAIPERQVRVPLRGIPRRPRSARSALSTVASPAAARPKSSPERARPAHPLPPARTPARTRKAFRRSGTLPTAPKRNRLTRAVGQVRAPTLVPRRGHGSILCRPKATEASEPSTAHRSCSSPAVPPAGKPAGSPTARTEPKLHPGRRLSRRSPEGDLVEKLHEKVALNHPEAPKSLRADVRVARSRSRERCGSQDNTEVPPLRDARDGRNQRDTHSRDCLQNRHPFECSNPISWHPPEGGCTLDLTVRSKSRAVPAHTTAEQPIRAGRPTASEDPAVRVAGFRRPEGRFRPTTSASDPLRGSIADGARHQTGCATRGLSLSHPKTRQPQETARSEGPTTPPMGFGAFRRSQPG